MSVLQRLLGKKANGWSHEIDSTIPINGDSTDQSVDLSLRIYFDDFTLSVYNNHRIINGDLEKLMGLELVEVKESDSKIEFHFGKAELVIDMTKDGYNGPEALSLTGPDNLIVVWN
jgi:hypothetical protein